MGRTALVKEVGVEKRECGRDISDLTREEGEDYGWQI
jgi:hypothetical protein